MKLFCLLLLTLCLISCSKQSSTEHLASAKAHLANQKYAAATIELKNAIKLSPKLAEARFLLGKAYLQSHQYESAEKELNRALEYGYSANEIMPMLSKAYQKTGADVELINLYINNRV